MPAIYVNAIAKVKQGAWPYALPGGYGEDEGHIRQYMDLARTEEGFQEYLARYIFDARRGRRRNDHGRVGGRRGASGRGLIEAIAGMLDGLGHVAVGASSPIRRRRLLAQSRRSARTRISVLGSERNFFNEGARELFDLAGQGRIDAFFPSGGQIDGTANVNLVAIGDYARPKVRFPALSARLTCITWCRG